MDNRAPNHGNEQKEPEHKHNPPHPQGLGFLVYGGIFSYDSGSNFINDITTLSPVDFDSHQPEPPELKAGDSDVEHLPEPEDDLGFIPHPELAAEEKQMALMSSFAHMFTTSQHIMGGISNSYSTMSWHRSSPQLTSRLANLNLYAEGYPKSDVFDSNCFKILRGQLKWASYFEKHNELMNELVFEIPYQFRCGIRGSLMQRPKYHTTSPQQLYDVDAIVEKSKLDVKSHGLELNSLKHPHTSAVVKMSEFTYNFSVFKLIIAYLRMFQKHCPLIMKLTEEQRDIFTRDTLFTMTIAYVSAPETEGFSKLMRLSFSVEMMKRNKKANDEALERKHGCLEGANKNPMQLIL